MDDYRLVCKACGWTGSLDEADYSEADGTFLCPICSDSDVNKERREEEE